MLVFALPAHAVEQPGGDDPLVRNSLQQDRNMDIGNGGALSAGAQNVLVDKWGQCRWLDNADDQIYLVPYRSSAEWAAFLNNAPSLITRARCCPARTITLSASDGQSVNFDIDTGREGGAGVLGARSFSHTFTLADSSTETVSEVYICQNEVWTGQGPTTVTTPGDCGAYSHGDTWWVDGATEHTDTDIVCPDGQAGIHRDYFQMQNQYICNSGSSDPTGVTQTVDVGGDEDICPPSTDFDEFVFASSCEAVMGAVKSCVSDGTSCVTPKNGPGIVQPMNRASHDGMWCSSIASHDTGLDGAKSVFDLADVMSRAPAGPVLVILPVDPWGGLRTKEYAHHVASPTMPSYIYDVGYPSPTYGATGSVAAIKMVITDRNVSQSKTITQSTVALVSGRPEDLSQNITIKLNYDGSTKQMAIEYGRSGRWMKNNFTPWQSQLEKGWGNGKVWSEVRVMAPVRPVCGAGYCGSIPPLEARCVLGTPSTVTTYNIPPAEQVLFGPTVRHTWTCMGPEGDTASCVSQDGGLCGMSFGM
ncbi:MAG: hypothetical protein AB7G06_03820 [Bdellovibrionales bacterium]